MKKLILIISIIAFSCTKSDIKQTVCYRCQGSDGQGNDFGQDICTSGDPLNEVQAAPAGNGATKITWHCKQK